LKRALRSAVVGTALVAGSLVGGSPGTSAADVTLTYTDWQLAQDIWGKSLREAIAEFEKQNPGIKVKPEPVQLGQRDVRLTTAIRAGQGPDVFALDANPVRQYIAEGWVKDLTPFIQADGGDALLSDFYPVALTPVTVDKKTYGLPMNTVAMVLVYNEKLYKAAGIPAAPKTWSEFRDTAQKLTGSSKPGGPKDRWAFTVVMAPAGFDLRVSSIIRSFGGDFLTKDWKHSAVNSPEVAEAFNYILDLVKSGTVPPGVSQVDANGARRMLANEQIAMKIGTTWSIPEVSGMNPALDGWNVLKMAPLPVPDGKDPAIRSTLYQKSLFLNKNTKHPKEAWKLAKFLTEPARMRKWFDDNQMLSSRISVNETYDKIAASDYAKIVTREIDRAAFLPLIPEWPQILEAFRLSLQAAIAGTKTSQQALADAHQEIEAILGRAKK
jgi:multiple sugar transport system substrate-binding protein